MPESIPKPSEPKAIQDIMFESRIAYLVTRILEAFRHSNPKNDWPKAALYAKQYLERLSGPKNPCDKMEALNSRLLSFAKIFEKGMDVQKAQSFARSAIILATQMGLLQSQHKRGHTNVTKQTLEKWAKKAIKQAISEGHTEESAAQRAAFEIYQKNRKMNEDLYHERRLTNHPLSDLLNLPALPHRPRAKEDIRSHLLRLVDEPQKGKNSKPSQLGGLLIKAAAFSPHRMRCLLGDDYFYKIKPLGFVDRNETIILIELSLPQYAHWATYQKRDILNRLKKDPIFRKVTTLQFRIGRHEQGKIGA